MKEDEVGKTCDTDGGEQKCLHSFGGKTWREDIAWKNLSVGRVIILKWILNKWDGKAWI